MASFNVKQIQTYKKKANKVYIKYAKKYTDDIRVFEHEIKNPGLSSSNLQKAINKALITLSYGRIVSTSCNALGLNVIIVDLVDANHVLL